MIGYVYKITLPNNKVYIGSKQSKIFNNDYWGSSYNHFYWKDLEKYGKENCKREILYEAETLEDLLEKEQYFIEQYGLFPKTYNLTTRAKSQRGGFYLCSICLMCEIFFAAFGFMPMAESWSTALKNPCSRCSHSSKSFSRISFISAARASFSAGLRNIHTLYFARIFFDSNKNWSKGDI